MVDRISIYPLSFIEFLRASGDDNLALYLESFKEIEAIPSAFFNPLAERLKAYFITGGMPEPVRLWVEQGDVAAVQQALINILALYALDFHKYPTPGMSQKIAYVWDSLPSQLARENKKFLYSAVKPGARAREYEEAIQWLADARLVSKVYRSSKPGLPLKAYDELDAFKLYLVDVGLLRRHAALAPSAYAEGDRLFTEFKGALTENYILQELQPQCEVMPRYWATDNPRHEVDFLMQWENEILPVEVKAGRSVKSRGLRYYTEKYDRQTKLRIRFSMENLTLDGNLLNIPLFMATQTTQLIPLALAALASA